jgi:predicted GNAT family N-acyltransferase
VVKIKKAENQFDFFNCMQIRTDVFIIEQNVSPTIELDEYDPTAIHFIAYEGDTPLGTARLVIIDNHGKVGRVAVNKAARGKKVGKKLMVAIEEYSKSIDLDYLVLGAQLAAMPFYEKLDYIAFGEIFLDAEIEHKNMKKDL